MHDADELGSNHYEDEAAESEVRGGEAGAPIRTSALRQTLRMAGVHQASADHDVRRSQGRPGKEAAERVSAGCYGAVVAASTLAGSAALSPGQLALLVVATNLVYFGTHVFAYTIGDADVERKHLHQVAGQHARVAAPMITAAFVPS